MLDAEGEFSFSGGGAGGGDVVEVLCDEDCEYQRLLGCVRPGAADAMKGRVPSLLSLIVNPRKEVRKGVVVVQVDGDDDDTKG